MIDSIDPVSGVRYVQTMKMECETLRDPLNIKLDGFRDNFLSDVQYPEASRSSLGESLGEAGNDVSAGDEEDAVSGQCEVLRAQEAPALPQQGARLVVEGVARGQRQGLKPDLNLPDQDSHGDPHH